LIFFGLGFGSSGPLRYQYKLGRIGRRVERADRSSDGQYASLAPGAYRFLVRGDRRR